MAGFVIFLSKVKKEAALSSDARNRQIREQMSPDDRVMLLLNRSLFQRKRKHPLKSVSAKFMLRQRHERGQKYARHTPMIATQPPVTSPTSGRTPSSNQPKK
mmetsp:Transcript_4751/g.10451  ORF Transcript_4751/g.10451 Transcript_4751/m.10451 type:complete len:102 (-) Transcript_4751:380-685(-)